MGDSQVDRAFRRAVSQRFELKGSRWGCQAKGLRTGVLLCCEVGGLCRAGACMLGGCGEERARGGAPAPPWRKATVAVR